MQILNLRPPEIAAAWSRGDIDGAYVWDPVLAEIKKSGSVLATSADVAQWGGPTFDAWIVSKKFAEAHPDIVTAFVRVTAMRRPPTAPIPRPGGRPRQKPKRSPD